MKGRFVATLTLGMSLFTTTLQAATQAHQWQITPFAGWAMFEEAKTVPPPLLVRQLEDAPYYGGRFGVQFTRNLGFELAGGMMNTKVDTAGGRDVDVWHVAADLIVSAPLGDPFDVFLLAGGGHQKTTPKDLAEQESGTFEVGAGFRWWLSRSIALRAEARSISPLRDGQSIHRTTVLGAGLTFGLGGQNPDADGDGVPDNKDTCPNTQTGVRVDANGCPTDADGDGIFDGLDQCPDTPKGARVDARGCPIDGDKDGVPDGIDQCDNSPAGAAVDAKGCPLDADGDGVPNGVDQCDNTPAGATVDAKGCPADADGDGVFDGIDKCPGTPSGMQVDASGCSVVNEQFRTELLETGKLRISNINFESGKAALMPESHAVLDEVGNVLTKWPELKFEIGGHSDSRGSATANKKLSEQRAGAVRDYLIQRFPNLTPGQVTVKGYGESKPLVKNDSPANMAKNRRVEFTVLNKEDLKK